MCTSPLKSITVTKLNPDILRQTCPCFSFHSGLYNGRLFSYIRQNDSNSWTHELQCTKTISVIASDVELLSLMVNQLKTRSTAFCTCVGKKLIQSTDLDISAPVIHLGIRTLTSSKFAHGRLLKMSIPITDWVRVCVAARQERHNCTTA